MSTDDVQRVGTQRFAFIFPMASGHINPSFAVARGLVDLGHEVHYLCREQMKEAVEDAGGIFHDELQEMPEMYEGRVPDLLGACDDLKKDYGLEKASKIVAMFKLGEIMLELMLPGAIRWLTRIQAKTVVCCPLINKEAVYAAKLLGMPCASLLTTAGPGSMAHAMKEILDLEGLTPEGMTQARLNFQPLQDSVARMEQKYKIDLDHSDVLTPLGRLQTCIESNLTLVTTAEDLQDPMTEELEQLYAASATRFEFVGPLLDKEGAKRAAGHKFSYQEQHSGHVEEHGVDPIALLKAAKCIGRPVVYVSMGTVITGDAEDWGWNGRVRSSDGQLKGLSGRELCRAAWGGAFDAFGSERAEDGPLLLVSLGPQADALGDGLEAPANSCCLPVMPQVDLLKAGVDVFLTHGGQNSFTEALHTGVPMVVCPGFADQPVNARKAVDLGVGLQVERPVPELGEASLAAQEAYRKASCKALREVLSNPSYKANALFRSERLKKAGGVPRAVELILQLGEQPRRLPCLLGYRNEVMPCKSIGTTHKELQGLRSL
mmetsp:Transcript_17794/g.31142  ORF Transcript_17794/g.31142 Transcript_17794/m.31142 type:complete len:546 (-) Transcript_17794:58-1695(-)